MGAKPVQHQGFLGTGTGTWAEQWEEGSGCAEHQTLTKTPMEWGWWSGANTLWGWAGLAVPGYKHISP